jgi:hypothetical protein
LPPASFAPQAISTPRRRAGADLTEALAPRFAGGWHFDEDSLVVIGRQRPTITQNRHLRRRVGDTAATPACRVNTSLWRVRRPAPASQTPHRHTAQDRRIWGIRADHRAAGETSRPPGNPGRV